MNIEQKIEQLSQQLNELARQQTLTTKRLIELMDELEQLKKQAGKQEPAPARERPRKFVELADTISPPPKQPETFFNTSNTQATATKTSTPKKKTTLEEFIGGNLTSKVGILITIIGIFIGAKYAIENNLVNPKVRVIMGYVNGLILVGVAIKLKKKYEQYSSVLMGGGLAVLYFITYIAYDFYSMLPQLAAFGLMLVFTAATVYASLIYNRIIIAHLGLIGAYAIPILLSDQSGRYAILFSYIAIINAGILILSLRKNWKSLFYVAFALTWIIFGWWYFVESDERHFYIAFNFVTIFFLIFYATFLAYKLIKKELYSVSDVVILLANAFIFYGIGYSLLSESTDTAWMVGLFTLINAFIHLEVTIIIKKLKLADKALFYLLAGLVITFITIAIPVQLDGNWVTLLWSMEALLVFIIGRTQGRTGYEKLSMVLTLLAFSSLLQDWSSHPAYFWTVDVTSPIQESPSIFFNIIFFTGLFAAVSQGIILYFHHWKKKEPDANELPGVVVFFDQLLPALFLATTYVVFLLEIQYYFAWAGDHGAGNVELASFNYVVVLLYSIIFASAVTFINNKWIKHRLLASFMLVLSGLIIILFIAQGLWHLNTLAELELTTSNTYFGPWNVVLRYILMAAASGLLYLGIQAFSLATKDMQLRRIFGAFIHVTILAMISYEYLLWMGRDDSDNEYKLGLSIVWSVYALFLVVAGIIRKKKHWRLTGIAFFVITLVKLFIYDLNQTTTISKTISFISLGAILLLVSYLYNRYKHVILMEDEEDVNKKAGT